MRIKNLLCSFALLALAGASQASAATSAATIDPNSDFDCAVLFDFSHRFTEAKPELADLREDTAIMNAWFIAQWMEHATEDPNRREHFMAMVKELGENAQAHGDALKTCSARANSHPLFGRFVKAYRETAPKAR